MKKFVICLAALLVAVSSFVLHQGQSDLQEFNCPGTTVKPTIGKCKSLKECGLECLCPFCDDCCRPDSWSR